MVIKWPTRNSGLTHLQNGGSFQSFWYVYQAGYVQSFCQLQAVWEIREPMCYMGSHMAMFVKTKSDPRYPEIAS